MDIQWTYTVSKMIDATALTHAEFCPRLWSRPLPPVPLSERGATLALVVVLLLFVYVATRCLLSASAATPKRDTHIANDFSIAWGEGDREGESPKVGRSF